jgi:hypothetical protein
MSSFVNGKRVFTAMVLVLTALMVYVTFIDRPQLAQKKNADQKGTAFSKFAGSDQITNDIRSESKEFTRVAVANLEDRENIAGYGRIVADYGSFVIVAKNKGADISSSRLGSQKIETTINLPGASFEPVSDPPANSLRLGRSATSNGKGYYIIQFGSTATDEWLESLRAAGVEILQYVPNQAYFVYGEGEAIAKAANHSRVRWIGSYTADQKLSPVVRDQIAAAKNKTSLRKGISPIELTQKGTAIFDVAVFSRADVDAVAERLKSDYSSSFSRVSRLRSNFFNIIRVELKPEDVEAVAAISDVYSIDAYIKPVREDERSAQIIAGNYSSLTSVNGPGYNPLVQFGVDGTNVTVSVVDDGVGIPGEGGFYITPSNAVNGPLRGATTGASGHGHLNATIIAGAPPFSVLDNAGYNYGLGIAPKAHIVNIPLLKSGYGGTDADIFNDSVLTPGPNGVHASISNNSWGAGTNGNTYSVLEAEYDGFVRDASIDSGIDPIFIVFSAGNSGASGLTRPKMAKNIISVANSENLRTEIAGLSANNIDDLSTTSSVGPAVGRVKPEISAPGSGVSGGRSGGDALFGNIDANHRWSSGTSHAAPQIAGMAALFSQWWVETRFGDRPSPALLKAAIINTSQDMNGNLSGAAIPNPNEGWGRANMKFMLNTGVGMKYIDEEIALANTGDSFGFFAGTVANSNKPVRVTLVWTDPPGAGLINNLDLEVTIGSTVYKGNVLSNGVSTTGGSADTVNNVETVILPAGIPAGTYFSVQVKPTALNGDGILNNGDFTDQNYAIVAYNYSNQQAPTFYTVSGRVISQSGRGVALAKVRITDPQSQVREALTNHLGYFTFANVASGQTHTITISSKRYTFLPQGITVNSNLSNISFVAQTGSP